MKSNGELENGRDANRWRALADAALADRPLSADEGLSVLRADDGELLDLLAAVYRVRRHWFGDRVNLNYLINAKSGLCGEDCGYCAQSRASSADIARYPLLDPDEIFEGARRAVQHRAKTYCTAISGRSPSDAEIAVFAKAFPRVKAAFGLKICLSAGLLSLDQARRLRQTGVDRVNHNLNTSERFYPNICSTHAYRDRIATLEAVREAGLEICSGGIVGMGEDDEDVVDLALQLGRLRVEALPINFLLPLPGIRLRTPPKRLTPRYCLKVLALFRLANPRGELRIAAGREMHLGPLQPLGLYAANSIFVGGYLTTDGQPPDDDRRMIEAAGFTIAE